jgi:hypothetical protein
MCVGFRDNRMSWSTTSRNSHAMRRKLAAGQVSGLLVTASDMLQSVRAWELAAHKCYLGNCHLGSDLLTICIGISGPRVSAHRWKEQWNKAMPQPTIPGQARVDAAGLARAPCLFYTHSLSSSAEDDSEAMCDNEQQNTSFCTPPHPWLQPCAEALIQGSVMCPTLPA